MQLLHSLYYAALFVQLCESRLATANRDPIFKRDPCVPLAQGWEQLDDSPAINDALKACGDGGTIVLPADQIYSIRTPINFGPCRDCDFQIEGQLVAAGGQWNYWNSVDSIFTIADVHGVKIRSLTGKGLIDGNAIEYYKTRWDSGYYTTVAFAHITNGSSNVQFDNLVLKNVMHRFFRASGNSTKITFSNLKLSMEEQWGLYPRNEYDAAGIELGDTSEIIISQVNLDFKARPEHGGTVGICLAIDGNTRNVTASNINCKNAWGGALVSLGSIGTYPKQVPVTVSDVRVSNFTFAGTTATGFLSYGTDSIMNNIVWDRVAVIKGTPATGTLCWLKSHSMTAYWYYCQRGLKSRVTDVWFKNFRGNLGQVPDVNSWINYNNETFTEFHVQDWQNSTVLRQ